VPETKMMVNPLIVAMPGGLARSPRQSLPIQEP
jgi:hypothetical protein